MPAVAYDPLDLLLGSVGRSPHGPALLAMQHDAASAGKPLRIEALLSFHPECHLFPGTLLDLVRAEIHDRRRRGEGVSAGDYDRFPELADSLQLLLSPEYDQVGASGFGSLARALDSVAAPVAERSTADPLDTTASADSLRERLPDIAGYAILGVLGRGGMGVVYKALHLRLDRVVALKMMAGRSTNPVRRMRFLAEADAVAKLQHPNIVQLFEIGEHDGESFFTLEYCPGGSLAALGKIDPREAASLVATLADAVAFAHAHGILHRDLKPDNVLLAAARVPSDSPLSTPHSPLPKIADFGLARRMDEEEGLTATGDVVGTPAYMAPEQAEPRGRTIGPAADVYGLGAILYRLLTGNPPFTGETPIATLRKVVQQEPEPPRRTNPDVPRDLESICLLALAKEPLHRYVSAEALGNDLRRFLAGEQVAARPVRGPIRAWRWAKRNRPLAGSLAALAIGLVGVTLLSVLFALSARRNARLERQALQTQAADAKRTALADQALRDGIDRTYAELNAGRPEDALAWFAALAPASPDTDDLVRDCRRDVHFAQRAAEIRLLGAESVSVKAADDGFDNGAVRDAHYMQLFLDVGLTDFDDDAARSSERIRDSRIGKVLFEAALDWAGVSPDTRRAHRLYAIAAGATDDPFQAALLGDLREGRDEAALARVPPAGQPAGILLVAARLRDECGKDAEALDLLRTARRDCPDDFWANIHLGKKLRAKGGTDALQEALSCFRAAVALRPKSAGARVQLATVLCNLGRPDEGLAECAAWRRDGRESAAIAFVEGRAHEARKDARAAMRAYRAALAIDGNYAIALYNLGLLHVAAGETAEALTTYAECNRVAPLYAQAWVNRANIHLRAKRYAEAEPLLRKATDLKPESAMAWNGLGVALKEQGKRADAVAAFRKALEHAPGHAGIQGNLDSLLKK